MHYVGFVDPDDMNVVSGKRKFTSLVGYSGSKLAQVRTYTKHHSILFFLLFFISETNGFTFYFPGQVMFSNVLLKRLPLETRISVVCLSPGIVLTNVVSITLSLTPLLVLHNLYHIKPF